MTDILTKNRPGHPRARETYRFDRRRNHSDLNRDRKTWYGVQGKLRPEPPAFTLKTSERGETHYVREDKLRTEKEQWDKHLWRRLG